MADISMLQTFTSITCCHSTCGLTFCVPVDWNTERRRDHTRFYCPNGHGQSYLVESDVEKERRARQRAEQKIEEERQRANRAREETEREIARRQHQERRASTFKGHCTRIRKKVQVGRCPCCDDTTFKNLRRHMLKHHPDWQPDAEPADAAAQTASG